MLRIRTPGLINKELNARLSLLNNEQNTRLTKIQNTRLTSTNWAPGLARSRLPGLITKELHTRLRNRKPDLLSGRIQCLQKRRPPGLVRTPMHHEDPAAKAVEEPAMGDRERERETREHLPSERKTDTSRRLGSSQNVGSVAQRLLSFHAGGDSEARERQKYGKNSHR